MRIQVTYLPSLPVERQAHSGTNSAAEQHLRSSYIRLYTSQRQSIIRVRVYSALAAKFCCRSNCEQVYIGNKDGRVDLPSRPPLSTSVCPGR